MTNTQHVYEILDNGTLKLRYKKYDDFVKDREEKKIKAGIYVWKVPNNIVIFDCGKGEEKSLILTNKQFQSICDKLKGGIEWKE